MAEEHIWPLYGLRVTTPRLELRLPDLAALAGLAAVAADGVHDEARMPFTVPWTDGGPEARARTTFQHVLGTVANWRPEEWMLSLAVRYGSGDGDGDGDGDGGRIVGRQDLGATDFAVTREAETGSWLGLAHQGRGIGTEMRAAVLHLAFAGLGARCVTSAAMTDNPASLAVSRKLGYAPDGLVTVAVRGEARTVRRLRLDRAAWEAHRTVPVEVRGLAPCRALFGV
ncbi:GNAT family N-acetyltransferase [Streptomyces carminius]|uniref:GNAT family N-acetyltransferase n=1 Tax=Streptomyces carminius TaxID=2665496 RepID=A0A2M8MBN3_9ACTN|nr:GNAT family protein [Streptomyces carminius]PJF01617.1 GNAT family N-acetyltransferase [Streptomyces carminius]